ncbi:hypothetical protein GCM10017673_40230 [Streptosporangium violaceochromogenes]|nr:hypothetical protein GCM10017673_40230 [Streptosporangium violaceochromogenes]
MIRRLRTLWADLAAIGDPVAVDTDWHDLPQDTEPDATTDNPAAPSGRARTHPHDASLPEEAAP